MPRRKACWSAVAMLVGSPRSGTTWLAKLVDSHPDVLYRHEPDSINVWPGLPFVPPTSSAEEWRPDARDYLALIEKERASKSSGSQPMFPKSYRNFLIESIRRGVIYTIKGGERMLGSPASLSGIQIPDMLGHSREENTLLFIKSVSSLCRTYMFSLARPDIRFVHIIRHPCAYVASTIRGKKLGLLSDDAYVETLAAMPEAQSYGITIEALRNMSREEQLTVRWMLQNEKVMTEMDNNKNYKRVIYEDLCSDPKAVVQELFAYLGLSMSPQTLEFIEQSSHGKTGEVRYFDVKRDSASAATGWTTELNHDQIESIRSVAAPSKVGQIYFSA